MRPCGIVYLIMELCHGIRQNADVAKSWGVNTWSKYQNLKDYICNGDGFQKYYVNFST